MEIFSPFSLVLKARRRGSRRKVEEEEEEEEEKEEDSESNQSVLRIWDSAFQNHVLLPNSNLPAIPTPRFLKDY